MADKKVITGGRACSILYNFLISNRFDIPSIVPANICETVPATYEKAGLRTLWVDLSEADFGMDRNQIEDHIKSCKGKAILHFNHTYGAVTKADDAYLEELKRRYPSLVIVDDRCLALPDLAPYASPADMVLYSTGPAKIVDIGKGGYAFLSGEYSYDDHSIAFSEKTEEAFEEYMKNARKQKTKLDRSVLSSDWLDLADSCGEDYFGVVKKELVNSALHRKEINTIYASMSFSMPLMYNSWRWNILVENKEECMNALFENGLFCSGHYMGLCGGYFDDLKTPVCDDLYGHVINLFNDHHYDAGQAQKTVEILEKTAVPYSIG